METSLFSQLKVDFLPDSDDCWTGSGEYRTFLQTVDDYSLLTSNQNCASSKQQSDTVSFLNSILSRKDRRLESLCLLRRFLEQCPAQVFTDNCSHWGTTLTKILSDASRDLSTGGSIVAEESFRVFTIFIERLNSFPESYRSFSSAVLPGFLTAVLDGSRTKTRADLREVNCEPILDVLVLCVRNFTGPCGQFIAKIEQLAVAALESRHKTVREAAGRCFSATARCTRGNAGGNVERGGVAGDKRTESWSNRAGRVLAAISAVLDQLYADLETGFACDGGRRMSSTILAGSSLQLSPLPASEPARTCLLVRQFQGLCATLRSLLSNEFPAIVKLPVEDILGLVCRTLGVLPRFLASRTSPARLRLLAVLPRIHQAALRALETLISCGRACLISHAGTINALFLQTLHSSSPSTTSLSESSVPRRQYRALRCATYRAAMCWLQELGLSTGVDALSVCTDFVQQILSDVRPKPHVVTLDTSLMSAKKTSQTTGSGVGGSRKRKHNGGGVDNRGLLMERSRANCAVFNGEDKELCVVALKVLRSMLIGCGACLPASQYSLILDFCLPLLAGIQRERSSATFPAPYDSPCCRLALYQLLRATIICSPSVLPPVNLIAGIFRGGLRDFNIKVRITCRESLAFCENLIHSRRSSLVQETPAYATKLLTPGGTATVAQSADTRMTDDEIIITAGNVSGRRRTENEPVIVSADVSNLLEKSNLSGSDKRSSARVVNISDDEGEVEEDDDADVVEMGDGSCDMMEDGEEGGETREGGGSVVELRKGSDAKDKMHRDLVGPTPSFVLALNEKCCEVDAESRMVAIGDRVVENTVSVTSSKAADEQPSTELELMLQSFVDADAD